MSHSLNFCTTEANGLYDKEWQPIKSPPVIVPQPLSAQSSGFTSSSSFDPTTSFRTSSDITTSGDDAEESYREKFTHLQILVKQLNRQLKSERIRKDGIDTLSRCLKEEREHNIRLKKDCESFESVIQKLQSRLAKHGLSTSVQLEAGETLVSGIVEQSAFDSLIQENQNLKSELKYLTIDPQKMEEAMKQNQELREKLTQLQHELSRLSSDKQNMHQVLSLNTDEKTLEISRLRTELDEMRHKALSKDVLCQSLSEQSQVLQQRLRETSSLCQQLLQRLEKLDPTPPGGSDAQSGLRPLFEKMKLQAGTGISATDPDQAYLERAALSRELTEIRTKLEEVTRVNQKWQEYHDRREAEFSAVQSRLNDTENTLTATRNSPQLSEQQQETIDRLVLQYKRQIGNLEEEREKVMEENRQLRMDHHTLLQTNEDLEQKIRHLLEQHRSLTPGGRLGSDDHAKIQALELQIKVCTEDFESERRDREKAQSRVSDLEEEVNIYKTQIESMQRGAQMQMNSQRRYGHGRAYNNFQCDMVNLDDVPMPEPTPVNLIGRGLEADTIMDEDEELSEGEDTVDQPPPSRSNKSPGKHSNHGNMINGNQDNLLQCPKCNKQYPQENHMDLVTHMDDCLK